MYGNTHGWSFLANTNMCRATHFLFGIAGDYLLFDHTNTQSLTVHRHPIVILFSRPQHVVSWPIANLVQIAPAPGDHLGEPLVPANVRLPANRLLDSARV